MKIFALSDIHGDTLWLEKKAQEAVDNKVDFVFLCGDILDNHQNTSNIIGPFSKRNLSVAILHGNHDTLESINFLSELYKITNLNGYSLQFGDIGFFGAGGALLGPFPTSEDTILKNIEKGFRYIKDAKFKILVTHQHPAGGLVEKMSYPGSKSIRKAIDMFKPNLHLCGHIHECAGIEDFIG